MKISVSFSALERCSSSRMRLLALGGFTRQVAAEGEALAFQPGGHQREHDGGGADQRHDAEAFAVRRLDQRRAGIGDRRAARLRQQAQRALCAQRRERVGFLADDLDAQLAHRHAERAEERARALGVLDHEVAQRSESP